MGSKPSPPYYNRLKVNDRDKQSTLFQYGINYNCKKIYSSAPCCAECLLSLYWLSLYCYAVMMLSLNCHYAQCGVVDCRYD
jgi:hypothetical protein